MAQKAVNLTERFLNAVKPPAKGRDIFRDTEVPGLGVSVQHTGSASFFWSRRVRKNLLWRTIGSCQDFSLDEARTRASEINGQIGKWRDNGCVGAVPIARPAKSVTLEQIFEDFCTFHVANTAKNPAKALRGAQWSFDRYLSSLRNRELHSIVRAELRELHAKIGKDHGPVAANRALQQLRSIISWAIAEERFAGGNVAAGIKGFPEYSRERVAQKSELQRLFAELTPEREPSRNLRDFVWLALMTGARKGDILSMQWSDLTLADHRWTVPSTTKSGRAYDIFLVPKAMEVIEERARRRRDSENPWVFPSRAACGHLASLQDGWEALRKRAGIVNLRMHDCRRTLASFQLAKGAAMATVGKSLGHSHNSRSTSIYARPSEEMVATAVGAAATAMLELEPSGAPRETPRTRRPALLPATVSTENVPRKKRARAES
jgi:integrase